MNTLSKGLRQLRYKLIKLYRQITGTQEFTTSGEYWDNRYRHGGNSGAGSYNNLAEFKGEIINQLVQEKGISSVIEFGCGDGNQLQYLKIRDYLGFDVSSKAIQLCTAMYKNDESKRFKVVAEYAGDKADMTMSLDVIYHLIEDETFHKYMELLFEAASQYVVVYSSNTDENTNDAHVRHRKFTNWIEKEQPTFKLKAHIPNKFPFNGDGKRTSFADFYIFEKQG